MPWESPKEIGYITPTRGDHLTQTVRTSTNEGIPAGRLRPARSPDQRMRVWRAKPTAPPPPISHAGWIRVPKTNAPATTASTAVSQSVMAARPSCQVTTAMSASEAALAPSRQAPAQRDARSFGISGFDAATSTDEGQTIPRAATTPPGPPPQGDPMNVTVVDT